MNSWMLEVAKGKNFVALSTVYSVIGLLMWTSYLTFPRNGDEMAALFRALWGNENCSLMQSASCGVQQSETSVLTIILTKEFVQNQRPSMYQNRDLNLIWTRACGFNSQQPTGWHLMREGRVFMVLVSHPFWEAQSVGQDNAKVTQQNASDDKTMNILNSKGKRKHIRTARTIKIKMDLLWVSR